MSGLIKADAARTHIVPLAARAQPCVTIVDPVLTALEERLVAATGEVARLTAELAAATAALPEQERSARDSGFAEGLAAATADLEQRASAIAAAATDAVAAWQRRLDDADGLAAELARIGLAKVFGDDCCRGELVVRAIARQVASLRRDTLVGIRVAAKDFDDPIERDALEAVVAATGAELVLDPALAAGDCQVALQLGAVDIGLDRQLAALDALLAELARS